MLLASLHRFGGKAPSVAAILRNRLVLLQPYVTAPKREWDCKDGLHTDLERLLREERHKPKDGFTLYVRHTGQAFNYIPLTKHTQPTGLQKQRIDNSRIKQYVTNPASIEDYLFAQPATTKELPPMTDLPGIYANLSKFRLTMLIVMTAMGGYVMAPGAFNALTFAALTLGTTLQSAAANATNQTMEVKYDSQMYRTRNRVLVRGLISREHAAAFAVASGLAGTGLLYAYVNPTVCYLGVLNYFLYTAAYTPMKRMSPLNTWIGAFVGAIPPMMGWAAVTGTVDLGACWMGLLLYIWQFPHFKALSWNIKNDYARAGYQMSANINPDQCKRVAFRHTIFMTLACLLGSPIGVTTDLFSLYSLPCNLYGCYLGYKFYSDGDSNSSRKLFRFSLVQIPYLLLMMLVCKDWSYNSSSSDLKYNEVNKNAST